MKKTIGILLAGMSLFSPFANAEWRGYGKDFNDEGFRFSVALENYEECQQEDRKQILQELVWLEFSILKKTWLEIIDNKFYELHEMSKNPDKYFKSKQEAEQGLKLRYRNINFYYERISKANELLNEIGITDDRPN